MKQAKMRRRWRRSVPLVLLVVALAAADLTAVGSASSASAATPLDDKLAAARAEIEAIARATPALAVDASKTLDELSNATWELLFGTWCSVADRLQAATVPLDHAESIAPASVKPLVQSAHADIARAQALALALSPERCARPDVFHVDPQVKPTVAPIADPVDGAPLPVGAIADEDGRLDQFTSNEILLETNDAARVQAFIARFGGRVIETIPVDPEDAADTQAQHVIRMDPARLLDTGRLAADLETLDPGYSGEIMLASDQQTLRLLATAARAQVEGFEVELDSVNQPFDVASSTTKDSPTACTTSADCSVRNDDWVPSDWNADAFTWNYMRDGSTQDVEVTNAWQLLNNLGKLKPTVNVGIIDSGFDPTYNGDFPTNTAGLTPGPRYSAFDTTWGSHGTLVASTLAGRLDNGVGAAGSAGPSVDKLVTVNLNGRGMMRAINSGLRQLNRNTVNIINMSIGGEHRVRFRRLTFKRQARVIKRLAANNVLVFAAAGNEKTDVDREKCGPLGNRCRERRDFLPCEFEGVRCVASLANDSRGRATSYSNWGQRDVDIYAPGQVWVGRSAQCVNCRVEKVHGTSIAAPFAAGVAALVWSARPSLTANEVFDIMKRTGKLVTGEGTAVYTYAGGAVRDAQQRAIRIVKPTPNQAFPAGATIPAELFAYADTGGAPTVTWLVGGTQVGTGTKPSIRLSQGTWTLTAVARFPDGATFRNNVTVTVGSPPVPG